MERAVSSASLDTVSKILPNPPIADPASGAGQEAVDGADGRGRGGEGRRRQEDLIARSVPWKSHNTQFLYPLLPQVHRAIALLLLAIYRAGQKSGPWVA